MKVIQTLERTAHAAIRPIDATTGLPVAGRLVVSSDRGRWARNRAGAWALLDADPGVVPGILTFAVTDADRLYLPRLGRVGLPRDPDPAHRDQAGSLFRAVDVPLFLAPGAPVRSSTWAVIRLSVRSTAGGSPGMPGALVSVREKLGGNPLAGGMTDRRGEALVAIAGLRAFAPAQGGDGAVETNEVEAVVTVTADPAYDRDGPSPPDPDDLASGRAGLKAAEADATLAPGRTLALTIDLDLA